MNKDLKQSIQHIIIIQCGLKNIINVYGVEKPNTNTKDTDFV